MLLQEIKSIYLAELEGLYPQEEITGIFNRVIDHYLGLQGFILAFQPQYMLTKEEEQPVFEALSHLKKEVPVQYVLGQTYFMDLPIQVDTTVLIPRPETEELVAWILADLGTSDGYLTILDVGTGSGNIAIALKKKLPGMQVYGLDQSKAALELAQKNAALNEVVVHWIHHDISQELSLDVTFDIVVSNPPYVLESEKASMRNNVKAYEPNDALYVDDADPLQYYRAILVRCERVLRPEGWVYFEINEQKGAEMEALLWEFGYSEIQLKKDIFGKDRIIKAKAPKR